DRNVTGVQTCALPISGVPFNLGLKGTPADARRYGNERLSEVFFAARDVAQLMDELGYYALWTAEHHFQREGYECFPNLIQLSLRSEERRVGKQGTARR